MEGRQENEAEGGLVFVRRLPADEDAPRAGRALAHEFLARLTCPDGERCDDMVLAVSELVSNAVLHGPPGELTLRLSVVDPTAVRVEVIDGGEVPFEWPDGLPHRGHWGLGLVRLMSERSGVEHIPHTRAWCEIDLAS